MTSFCNLRQLNQLNITTFNYHITLICSMFNFPLFDLNMSLVQDTLSISNFISILINQIFEYFTLVLPIQGVLEGRDKVPKYLKKSLLLMKEDSSIGR